MRFFLVAHPKEFGFGLEDGEFCFLMYWLIQLTHLIRVYTHLKCVLVFTSQQPGFGDLQAAIGFDSFWIFCLEPDAFLHYEIFVV